jgi:hypothetical protein
MYKGDGRIERRKEEVTGRPRKAGSILLISSCGHHLDVVIDLPQIT